MSSRVQKLGLGAALTAAIAMVTTGQAVADPPFSAPPFFAFTPNPSAWNADTGTMKNLAPGAKKRLLIPLGYESVSWMAGTVWHWQATLEAGGATPSSTIQCAMYAVANDTILNQSATAYFNGSSSTISLEITSTLCRTVYVDCWVPQNGWIGNITWQYDPVSDL